MMNMRLQIVRRWRHRLLRVVCVLVGHRWAKPMPWSMSVTYADSRPEASTGGWTCVCERCLKSVEVAGPDEDEVRRFIDEVENQQ